MQKYILDTESRLKKIFGENYSLFNCRKNEDLPKIHSVVHAFFEDDSDVFQTQPGTAFRLYFNAKGKAVAFGHIPIQEEKQINKRHTVIWFYENRVTSPSTNIFAQ